MFKTVKSKYEKPKTNIILVKKKELTKSPVVSWKLINKTIRVIEVINDISDCLRFVISAMKTSGEKQKKLNVNGETFKRRK